MLNDVLNIYIYIYPLISKHHLLVMNSLYLLFTILNLIIGLYFNFFFLVFVFIEFQSMAFVSDDCAPYY